jgi:hypothetical protein
MLRCDRPLHTLIIGEQATEVNGPIAPFDRRQALHPALIPTFRSSNTLRNSPRRPVLAEVSKSQALATNSVAVGGPV